MGIKYATDKILTSKNETNSINFKGTLSFCNQKPFKNDGKCLLFHFKSSFHSQDI